MHKTNNLEDGYLGSGKYIYNAIKKYGKENFKREILHFCKDEEEMRNKEKEIITEQFLEENKGKTYNLSTGGKGSFNYINKHPDHKKWALNGWNKALEKISILNKDPDHIKKKSIKLKNLAKRRKENGWIPFVDLYGIKIKTKGTTDLKFSDNSKKKMSTKKLGSLNSQFGTFWITNGNENKKCKSEIPEGWIKGRILNFKKKNKEYNYFNKNF